MKQMERLKRGDFKKMTAEEQREHIHALAKRWRERNKDKVKRTNAYFSQKYREEKPYDSVCKYCGKIFPSFRKNSNKICAECWEDIRHRVEMKKKAETIRREARKVMHEMILELHNAGYKQQEIADKLVIGQSGVSQILIRKYGIRKVAKIKRKKK